MSRFSYELLEEFINFVFTLQDVPLVEVMYLVFIRMQDDSYQRRLMSLFCLCDVFRALINTSVC